MIKDEPIKIRLKEKYVKQLLARGMNRLAMAVRPFTLKPASFTSQIEGLKPKSIDSEQQLTWFRQLVEDPLKPWCYCITSEPNDRMAKMVAAYIMQAAILQTVDRMPLWHDILGSFSNPLIGPNVSRPSLLVLGNVMPNSTAVKFEKLRDILEYHSNIPRIIVSSGDNPFSFFAKNLHYPLSGCLYLKTNLVKADIEI
jgi:hypothetical protein